MVLELKHLAPYLPYQLRIQRLAETDNPQTVTLKSGIISLWQDDYYLEFKPVLRPLSDLTKEMTHNDRVIMPYKLLENELLLDGQLEFGISMYGWIGFHNEGLKAFYPVYMDDSILGECTYSMVELLLELHFDVFGLIPSGLAIDINTLPA